MQVRKHDEALWELYARNRGASLNRNLMLTADEKTQIRGALESIDADFG
jgi:hypothetical protein